MTDNPRNIINSPFGLKLAYFISRYTPTWLGRRVAIFAAQYISTRKDWRLVKAVRCNQWIVNGEPRDPSSVDKLVMDNFCNIADSIFDLYHNLDNPKAFQRMIKPNPITTQLVSRPEFSDRGLILAGLHMTNFDLAFQMGGLAGIKAFALTLPELNAGYQRQRDMREQQGLRVVQASVGSLKYTVDYLRSGGLVITGLDRPDVSYPYRPQFFGRPAALPIHHVFLALKAKVPVIVGATYQQPDGSYRLQYSEPIEMQPHADRQTEIMINTERILNVAEEFIRQAPSQWAMTFPVWPDLGDQVPG